jgi:hypothetical protein
LENGTSVKNEYKNKSFLKSDLILLCSKVKLSKVRKAKVAKKFSNLVVSTTPTSLIVATTVPGNFSFSILF